MQKKLPRYLFAILMFLLPVLVKAQLSAVYSTLSPTGSVWKYSDNGTLPGATWTDSLFNDGAWASGPAYLGYGDTWIVTCIHSGCSPTIQCTPTCTNKYIAYYFRRNINISNLAALDSIRLGLVRDDGAVVYVNGAEVWRDNMPAGTITATTGAAANVGGATENTMFFKTIKKSFFVNGNNTISVEVHNDVATSSDITFELQVEGVKYVPVPVTLTRGPYLQMGNQNGVTVSWRTNVASRSVVRAGSAVGNFTYAIYDTNKVTDHAVKLFGLTPDTKLYYQFGTDTSVLQGDTSNFFTTAPPDSSSRKVTVALFGDCGRNDLNYQPTSIASYYKYINAKGMKAADILLLNGDNAYTNGTDAEYTTGFFNAYGNNILKNHMVFPAPGNHDYNNGSLTAQQLHNVPYYSIFTMPTQGECGGLASNTPAYYSFNWGNVHFLSLDSYGMEDYGTTRMYDTNGTQVKWIKKDLAANTKKWVVAYWHHPPFTMGSHNSDNEAELINIRTNFIRILERMGVDLILCGHSHDYERSYLLKGYYGTEASFNKAVHTADTSSGKYDGSTNSCPYTYQSGQYNHGAVYVVAGSSGANDGIQAGYPHDALPYSFHDGGMFYFEIQDNRLDAKFIRRDSVIADQFTIMKDAKKTETISVIKGETVKLKASWLGSYAWNTGDATQTITLAPAHDTSFTVSDSTGHSCFTEQFTLKVTDTSHTDTTTHVASVMELDGSKIYPVPAKDVLYFEMSTGKAGDYTFTIYDMDGRLLQSSTQYLGRGEQKVNIDVHSLPARQMMMLKVNNENNNRSFRFTRE